MTRAPSAYNFFLNIQIEIRNNAFSYQFQLFAMLIFVNHTHFTYSMYIHKNSHLAAGYRCNI